MASALSGTSPTNHLLRKIDRFWAESGARMKEGIVGRRGLRGPVILLGRFERWRASKLRVADLYLASVVPIKMRQVWNELDPGFRTIG